MGALTHNGEIMQGLPANANQINFDKTGTDLNATQTEAAIKEVNTKVNTNTTDINQLKSGLTNLKYHKVAESASTGTYSDKLQSLSTVYSTLSSNQKKSAILVRSDTDYFNAVNNSGAFSNIYLDNSDLVITCFRLAQGEYIYSVNGNKTDGSSVSDNTVMSLWVCE